LGKKNQKEGGKNKKKSQKTVNYTPPSQFEITEVTSWRDFLGRILEILGTKSKLLVGSYKV
jgi:hypothetical protein